MADNSFPSFLKYLFGIAFLRRVIPIVGSVLFLFYMGFFLWTSLGPQKPYPDTQRQKAAETAVKKIVEEIRANRGDLREVVLLHFYNDPTDFFSDSLRDSLDSCGVLNLSDTDFSEKLGKQLNLHIKGTNSTRDALNEVKNCDVDGVLWGSLDLFESSNSGVILKGSWHLVDKKTKQEIYTGVIHVDTTTQQSQQTAAAVQEMKEKIQENTEAVERVSTIVPWYIRLMGYILLVLLLPIVTISFIRTMVAKQSNRVNAFLLSVYTFIDAIFAFFMIGGTFTSIVSVICFLVAVVLAFLYNIYLMTFALRLEKN